MNNFIRTYIKWCYSSFLFTSLLVPLTNKWNVFTAPSSNNQENGLYVHCSLGKEKDGEKCCRESIVLSNCRASLSGGFNFARQWGKEIHFIRKERVRGLGLAFTSGISRTEERGIPASNCVAKIATSASRRWSTKPNNFFEGTVVSYDWMRWFWIYIFSCSKNYSLADIYLLTYNMYIYVCVCIHIIHTITRKINYTPRGVYLPISKLLSI